MSETPPTLQALVAAFEQKGVLLVPELHENPALVHCGNPDTKPEPSMGYETRAMTAPWDARVAIALVRSGTQANPELMSKAGAVYAVVKRPGGPFPDRIGVGRTRAADISLRMGSVSKYHAYFTHIEAKRSWEVWDARSRNGTVVGQRKLEAGGGTTLTNGTQLLFGDEAFLFFTPTGLRSLLESIAQSYPGR